MVEKRNNMVYHRVQDARGGPNLTSQFVSVPADNEPLGPRACCGGMLLMFCFSQ